MHNSAYLYIGTQRVGRQILGDEKSEIAPKTATFGVRAVGHVELIENKEA
jgi:hypothetical protein